MDKFKHLHNQMLNCNLNEKLKEKEKIEKEYFLKMNDNRDKMNFCKLKAPFDSHINSTKGIGILSIYLIKSFKDIFCVLL